MLATSVNASSVALIPAESAISRAVLITLFLSSFDAAFFMPLILLIDICSKSDSNTPDAIPVAITCHVGAPRSIISFIELLIAERPSRTSPAHGTPTAVPIPTAASESSPDIKVLYTNFPVSPISADAPERNASVYFANSESSRSLSPAFIK